MIDLSFLAKKRVAVLGLARSGEAAARALMASGVEIVAWDDDAKRRAALSDLPLTDLAAADWRRIAMLVLSPGIPHTYPAPHPVAAAARAAGCPIVSDVELLWHGARDARFVGITGTNGKSTTTTLLGHILASAGRPVATGGNLGTPALSLPRLGSSGIYVLEMSSYQLEITPTAVFDVAVLLNLTPDHLDRHGGMAGYTAAKRMIFRGQDDEATAIIGVDDGTCRRIRADLTASGRQRVIAISGTDAATGGVSVAGRWLVDDMDRLARPIADLSRARALPGAHNGQNAAAAYAAARALGVPAEAASKALLDFPGLAHRQEAVGTIRGVRYVNDSKATNAEAAARALDSYDSIFWIAGGVPKEGGIAGLAPLFPRIVQAFLIGQAASDFARTLEGRVPYMQCGDLANAVREARAAAERSPRRPAVVLLSPACASFDQFRDFEARGDAFRAIVAQLAAEASREGAAA